MQKKKKKELDHQFTLYTRIHSKWIKHLNISHDTIKAPLENIGSKISDIPQSNIFANISPRAREIKENINKWDYIKLKKLLHVKRYHHQNEKETNHMGEHICQ